MGRGGTLRSPSRASPISSSSSSSAAKSSFARYIYFLSDIPGNDFQSLPSSLLPHWNNVVHGLFGILLASPALEEKYRVSSMHEGSVILACSG